MPGLSDSFDLTAELADIPGGHVIDPSAPATIAPPVTPTPTNPPTPNPQATPPASPPVAVPAIDWLDKAKPLFKEILEEEPDSVDAIKAKLVELKDLRTKIKDHNPEQVKAINTRLKELQAENEELMKDVNPLAHFRSEDAYKAEQLAKMFPENNPDSIHKIMAADLDKMSVVDAIRLHLEFTYGITSPTEQTEWIEEQYGVDVSEEDFTPKAKMKTDAMDFKKSLKGVKATEIPKIKDYKTIKEQRGVESKAKEEKLAADWSPVVEKAVSMLKKISIPLKNSEGKDDSFEFAIEETTLVPYAKKVTEILSKGGRELNEDNLKGAMSSVYERLLIDNFQKIVTSYTNQKLAELDENWAKETNNPRKINQAQRPPVHQELKPNSKEAAEAELLRGL